MSAMRMPEIKTKLQLGSNGQEVKLLQGELDALGGDLAAGEVKNSLFGDTTKAAVLGFQTLHGLEPTGIVDAATGALMRAAVRFTTEGSTAEMRHELGAALQANPKQPALAHWLARYEIIARDYDAARETLDQLRAMPNADGFLTSLEDIPQDPAQNQATPDVLYPQNYYAYRYSLLDLPTIERLQKALARSIPSSASTLARPLDQSVIYLLPTGEGGYPDIPIDPSDPSPSPPPTPEPPPDPSGPQVERAGYQAMSALRHWFLGNQDLSRGLFARAVNHYTQCQFAVLDYFRFLNPTFRPSQSESLSTRLILLMTDLYEDRNNRSYFFQIFHQRSASVSLDELYGIDWRNPGNYLSAAMKAQDIITLLNTDDEPHRQERQNGLEAPLVTLCYILAPLARAEANRQRRQFQDALRDCDQVLDPLLILGPPTLPGSVRLPGVAPFKLVAEFIELPFARQLAARILLDKADTEYKARTLADPQKFPQADQYQGLEAAQTYLRVLDLFADEGDYTDRVETATTRLSNDVERLLAKRFYPLVPSSNGESPLSETERREFLTLGKQITIPTIASETKALPGLDKRSGPHEPLLRVEFPDAGATTNLVVYALVVEARARLLQIEAGFNYLGYGDDYIPPWRFQFLLERARYFTEHAKNTQRDYLNFLGNAEQQEFQELSAAQAVEMEKSNIQIETARVEQSRMEVEVSKLSQELAQLTEEDAQRRLDRYKEFDDLADNLDVVIGAASSASALGATASGALSGAATGAALGASGGPIGLGVGAILGGVAGFLSGGGGATAEIASVAIAAEQREYEKFNLSLAVPEASLASDVASEQVGISQAGLVVAGMQRAAALLRHEFAVQNLNFLRNRTLNAEMWYRLAAIIRDISNTYMRYAVELAFLAEQAYEFEANERINVIHFDYDVSEVGSLLAADFLLRDLDTIEQDLIVNQQQRQQQARYILSLAREFPEALQDLRDTGATIFSLRLEQLERRFPGLYNIRIGAVDVTPVALMDPTRFSLEMTYLGASQIRLKAQPDTPPGVPTTTPLNENDLDQFLFVAPANVIAGELDKGIFSNQFRQLFITNGVSLPNQANVKQVEAGLVWRISPDKIDKEYLVRKKDKELYVYLIEVDDDWLRDIRDEWPVKIRTTGPETAVFSGLTPQERSAIFPFVSTGQRNDFEGLGAAAPWRIDMSMKENQVVPGTLVDLLLTFTVSGYYDVDLRTAVDAGRRRAAVLTQWLSARQRFADAFYEFNHTGRMTWEVTGDMLSLDAPLRNLRNLGIILLPASRQVQFSRLMSSYTVELAVEQGGQFQVLTPIPEVTFSVNQLDVTATVDGVNSTTISWDFGDGSGFQSSNQHTYKHPGQYRLGLRLEQDSHLYEYYAEIAVSRTQSLASPLRASPVFAQAPGLVAGILASAKVPGNEDVTVIWKVDQAPAQRGPQDVLELPAGKHVVTFTAVRKLNGRVYSQGRFVPDQALALDGLRINTNRVFELDGTETTGSGNHAPANALTEHLFPLDPSSNQRLALSPVDHWTLEVSPDDNPFLRSVTSNDNLQVDLDEVEDAILILEYETGIS
jgi:peptidoglycan hydrolase-like protein with peptidoglycan-binding domain